MKNKLSFSVEDIRVIDYELDASQFSLLAVDCFATGKSLHDTFVTEETLRKTANTILLKPFVFEIDENFDDLGTHSKKEVAGGFVPHNSPIEFKTLEDGRLMMSVQVLIWKRYSGKLLEYFARDNKKKGVSVEIEVYEAREDEKTGLTEILDFCYNAITALGDLISPAIPDAQAILQFSKEFEEAKNKFQFSSRYDELDFTIPADIKKNAKKALESKKGSSVALALARFLSTNEKINPERIRQIYKFFKNKNIKEMDEIVLGLYGGKQGYLWSKDLFEKMDEMDKKNLSYFGEEPQVLNENLIFSLNSAQIYEILNGCLVETYGENKYRKYWLETYDDECVYIRDNEEDKVYCASYTLDKEAKTAEINLQEKHPVIRGGYETVGNTMKEDIINMAEKVIDEKDKNEQETPEEDKKEDSKEEKEKFSYAELFGIPQEEFAKMFAEDEEDDEETKSKFASAKEEFGVGNNPVAMMSGMFAAMKKVMARMSKLEEDGKTYMAENEDLKKFKADVESKQKEFAVKLTLKELSEKVVIPADKLSEMEKKAEEYTLDNIDGWKNYCKALSFDFKDNKPLDKSEEIDEGLIDFALPWNNVPVANDPNDIWAEVSK